MAERDDEIVDLAVIGAGIAGTFVSHEVGRARRDWSIVLFERLPRIGGRLRSVHPAGLNGHPIELGGMRYQTDQPLVSRLIEALEVVAFRPLRGGRARVDVYEAIEILGDACRG